MTSAQGRHLLDHNPDCGVRYHVKKKTGSIKRLGTAFMGVVDNMLLHVWTEGRCSKIKGEVEEKVPVRKPSFILLSPLANVYGNNTLPI